MEIFNVVLFVYPFYVLFEFDKKAAINNAIYVLYKQTRWKIGTKTKTFERETKRYRRKLISYLI